MVTTQGPITKGEQIGFSVQVLATILPCPCCVYGLVAAYYYYRVHRGPRCRSETIAYYLGFTRVRDVGKFTSEVLSIVNVMRAQPLILKLLAPMVD